MVNNENVKTTAKLGNMRVLEYLNDVSVTPTGAVTAYFASKMNVRKKQVLIELNDDEYTVSAGAMQWTLGNVEIESGQAELIISKKEDILLDELAKEISGEESKNEFIVLDTYFGERDRAALVTDRASDLKHTVSSAISRVLRKIEAQNAELSECAEGELFKRDADLIVANIYRLK